MTALQALPNTVCPLCGGANACAPAREGRLDVPCWCTTAAIDPAALARVLPDLIDKACLCPRCAAGVDRDHAGGASPPPVAARSSSSARSKS